MRRTVDAVLIAAGVVCLTLAVLPSLGSAAPHAGAARASVAPDPDAAAGAWDPGGVRSPAGAGADLTGSGPAGLQKSIQEGVYSSAQLERGTEVYETVCIECHMADEFGPGSYGFLEGWSGQTVKMLYDQIQSTMPYETPGSLEPGQYVDVLAYIFKLNGLPAGEDEMKADGSLEGIVIEGPFTSPDGGRPDGAPAGARPEAEAAGPCC